MEWISGVAGALVLVLVLTSTLRTLVVPRGLYSVLVFRLWWLLRRLLRLAAPRGDYHAIDRAQTWLAPLMLIGMLVTWLGGALLGFGLLLYAASPLSWTTAFREAGSSLFTLGFASGARLKLSVLDFMAAATGPVLIALQIAYLPTLYAAYNRRELEVTLLQARAGEPAWGPEILARQWLVDTETALPELYRAWERLAPDMGESHSTHPVLLSFRSPRPHRSWLVGLVAVMDAAALQLALDPRLAPPEAACVLRAGFTALRDIARVVRIPFDPDPSPGSPIRLTFEEFDEAVAMLGRPASVGTQPEGGRPHFQGWRVSYEEVAYELLPPLRRWCRACGPAPRLLGRAHPAAAPGGPQARRRTAGTAPRPGVVSPPSDGKIPAEGPVHAKEPMIVRIVLLGTAAGGGFPQWNCACALCAAARKGTLPSRTQECAAVTGNGRDWWLLNASPDLRAQLTATPALWPGPGPGTPCCAGACSPTRRRTTSPV
ncbi:hypothetical protein O1M54_45350 [Streptomyces diastatochromogenes]|nr:hypothetical protein [Streptomyces diastatochromogenes]